jgi:hypothetical protein
MCHDGSTRPLSEPLEDAPAHLLLRSLPPQVSETKEVREMPESLWIATAKIPAFEPLKGDVTVDAAIIGAGISGITAASFWRGRSPLAT